MNGDKNVKTLITFYYVCEILWPAQTTPKSSQVREVQGQEKWESIHREESCSGIYIISLSFIRTLSKCSWFRRRSLILIKCFTVKYNLKSSIIVKQYTFSNLRYSINFNFLVFTILDFYSLHALIPCYETRIKEKIKKEWKREGRMKERENVRLREEEEERAKERSNERERAKMRESYLS